MEFKYYDPKQLIPAFKHQDIPDSYRVCNGCVVSGVSPEFCFHSEDWFSENQFQSDSLCFHCCDAAEETRKSIPLSGNDLSVRVAELEAIRKMASS
jgi:hypothetical protein